MSRQLLFVLSTDSGIEPSAWRHAIPLEMWVHVKQSEGAEPANVYFLRKRNGEVTPLGRKELLTHIHLYKLVKEYDYGLGVSVWRYLLQGE